jgi:glycine/D-amino acid oxidase-like deaminating enzyme
MFKEVVDANFSYKYWRQLSDGRLIIGGFTGHGLGFAAGSSKVAAELLVNGFSKTSDLFRPKRFNFKGRA